MGRTENQNKLTGVKCPPGMNLDRMGCEEQQFAISSAATEKTHGRSSQDLRSSVPQANGQLCAVCE